MDHLTRFIGSRLRLLRQQKGWSLDKTAEMTAVSKAMLGQIERFESSPTVATLWKIASGFRVSFSSFLKENLDAQNTNFIHTKPRLINHHQEKLYLTPLIPFDEQLNFEVFEIELLSGCKQLSSAHAKGVIEHIIVVSGEIDILIKEKWQPLKAGDSLRFNADVLHGYRNLNPKPAIFHNVIHYPHEKNYKI
ncbi:DNA-binding transcriptional regulator [Legionella busanensis]|uniref:DNA-binding transcriptional regulator n=1 Tax=Legionella busanensis TaxID=190655 RepID=A0A378JSP2_9GAMM|nr:XRE family transcriptional regulator [Legionella busanensis]STX52810.1 DNA-binding transcriptional regulator [Legionella busanensis]